MSFSIYTTNLEFFLGIIIPSLLIVLGLAILSNKNGLINFTEVFAMFIFLPLVGLMLFLLITGVFSNLAEMTTGQKFHFPQKTEVPLIIGIIVFLYALGHKSIDRQMFFTVRNAQKDMEKLEKQKSEDV